METFLEFYSSYELNCTLCLFIAFRDSQNRYFILKAEFLCYLYYIMEHSKIILDIFSPDIVFKNVVLFNLSLKRSLFFVCIIFFAS